MCGDFAVLHEDAKFHQSVHMSNVRTGCSIRSVSGAEKGWESEPKPRDSETLVHVIACDMTNCPLDVDNAAKTKGRRPSEPLKTTGWVEEQS